MLCKPHHIYKALTKPKSDSNANVAYQSSSQESRSYFHSFQIYLKKLNSRNSKNEVQTTASQDVLIFLFGLVDLLASGVNVDRGTSFQCPKFHFHTSHVESWNFICLPNWHQENCCQRILRVGSFFSPVLQPTQSTAASKLTTSASWESKRLCIKKVKSPAGSSIDPQSLASISLQSSSAFCLEGRSAGFDGDGTLSIQAAKGVSVSIMEIAHKSKNMAVDGLLRLMRPSLHASLSMKQIPQRDAQLFLQARLTHRHAYISTSQII